MGNTKHRLIIDTVTERNMHKSFGNGDYFDYRCQIYRSQRSTFGYGSECLPNPT